MLTALSTPLGSMPDLVRLRRVAAHKLRAQRWPSKLSLSDKSLRSSEREARHILSCPTDLEGLSPLVRCMMRLHLDSIERTLQIPLNPREEYEGGRLNLPTWSCGACTPVCI